MNLPSNGRSIPSPSACFFGKCKRFVQFCCLLGTLSLAGCEKLPQEGSKATAEAKLAAELDKWLAKQEHEAAHIELLHAVLIDYEIQTLHATTPDIVFDDIPKWDESDPPPAFLATVKVEVETLGVPPITKVILYRMAWDRVKKDWRIRHSLEGM